MPVTTPGPGRNVAIRFKNTLATPVYVAMAAMKTKKIAFNNEIVDVSNSDSTGQFRELLTGGGIKSMSLAGAGVSSDKASLVVIQSAVFDGSVRDGDVVIPGIGTFVSKFTVSSFNITGEYNGAIMFDWSLESSGIITFTVEP